MSSVALHQAPVLAGLRSSSKRPLQKSQEHCRQGSTIPPSISRPISSKRGDISWPDTTWENSAAASGHKFFPLYPISWMVWEKLKEGQGERWRILGEPEGTAVLSLMPATCAFHKGQPRKQSIMFSGACANEAPFVLAFLKLMHPRIEQEREKL